ncbi:hypothetical protein C8R44DRAFT_732085 [Mycena epipterygia]|nr:hypothetical protein C8R44DRAFT_732085 [Mycena epipterygia]
MFRLLIAQKIRRLPDAGDKCRLQCVRLLRTHDVRGLVLLPHSHVLRPVTAARHARRTPRAFSRGVGCRARLLAPRRRHGGARGNTTSLQAHLRVCATSVRTIEGRPMAPRPVRTPDNLGVRRPRTCASSRAPAYDFTYPRRASIHRTPNACTIPRGSFRAPPQIRKPAHAESLRTMERGHATPHAGTFALPQNVHLATLVGVPSVHESPRRTNTLDRDTRYATRTTCAPETRTYGIHPYGGPRTTHASPAAIA